MPEPGHLGTERCHRRTGEPAPARLLFERARDLRRRILGDDHPNTLESAGSLSLNLWELGQFEPARQFGEDTLTRMRRVLGDDHPHTLRAARNFADTISQIVQEDPMRGHARGPIEEMTD
jgi:Tetratricopeptide repeat